MLTSLGVSAMSCSRGVGMPPHRSSTALRSVMLPLLVDPRKPGTSPTTCPPAPMARSGVPRSTSSRGDALSLAICRRGGRRFFTGPPTTIKGACPPLSAPLLSASERRPRSVFRAPEPVALSTSPRAESGASARPPRGDRRTPRALGRSPRWGEARSPRSTFSLGDGIARLESPETPETPETPEGTSRSGTVNAAPRKRFSLRGDAEGDSAPPPRRAPLFVLAISESRRLEPGESVPSVSSASAAALSQKRGVTSGAPRGVAPRAGADFFENAFSCVLDSARRLAPTADSFERSAERLVSRGLSVRDAPTPRLPAVGAEWSEERKREERKRQKRRRTSVSRLRGSERGRRVALRVAFSDRGSRDGTRGEKRPRPAGAAFRETGGRAAARTPARARWGWTWRARCPRASGVSRASRAGARAGEDARRRASRGASLEQRAGRGPVNTSNPTTSGTRTSLAGDGRVVVVLVLESHRVGRVGIALHVLARGAVRGRAPVVGAGEGRALDDFLPVLPPAVGVVAGHREGGRTAGAFSASGLLARCTGVRSGGCGVRGSDLWRLEADRGTRSEKCAADRITTSVLQSKLNFGKRKVGPIASSIDKRPPTEFQFQTVTPL